MDPVPRQSNNPNLPPGIIHFSPNHTILAINLVNIPAYIIRNIAQGLMSIALINLIIFIVLIFSVYLTYDFYVKIFKKRKASGIQISRKALKGLILGLLHGFHLILNSVQYGILGFPEIERITGLIKVQYSANDKFILNYRRKSPA